LDTSNNTAYSAILKDMYSAATSFFASPPSDKFKLNAAFYNQDYAEIGYKLDPGIKESFMVRVSLHCACLPSKTPLPLPVPSLPLGSPHFK